MTNHTTKTELPTSVLIKFLFFSFLMVAAPTGTFFISKRYFTDVMYSAVAALAAVNVVLFLFVMVAFLEDDGPAYSKKNE